MRVQNIVDGEGNVIGSELVFRFPPLRSNEELEKFIKKIETELKDLYNFEKQD
jgi:hypothetical protein